MLAEDDDGCAVLAALALGVGDVDDDNDDDDDVGGSGDDVDDSDGGGDASHAVIDVVTLSAATVTDACGARVCSDVMGGAVGTSPSPHTITQSAITRF